MLNTILIDSGPLIALFDKDARSVAESLQNSGWIVISVFDADRRSMLRSAGSFRDKLSATRGSTGFLFYAGHGLPLQGENFLVPVGSDIQTEDGVSVDGVAMTSIMEAFTASQAYTPIVILDACRDNPFVKKATRSASKTRGLTVQQTDTGGGTAVIFSTSPNDVAQDGAGNHGGFTESLLKYISSPGLKIEDMMKKVRQDVLTETGGKQQPWSSFSLSDDFYVAGAGAPSQITPAPNYVAPNPAIIPPSKQEKPASGGSGAQLVSLHLQRASLVKSLDDQKNTKPTLETFAWIGLGMLVAGAASSLTSYLAATDSRSKYDDASNTASAAQSRQSLGTLNTVFNIGFWGGIAGVATLGISLLASPDSGGLQKQIETVDTQIRLLEANN